MSNIDYKKLITDLDEHGMPVAEFAAVLRLENVRFASKTRLNEAFRDINPVPLRDDTAHEVLRIWTEISMLQFWLYVATGTTLKVDLSNGEKVHEWLVDLRRRMAEEQDNNRNRTDTEPAYNAQA